MILALLEPSGHPDLALLRRAAASPDTVYWLDGRLGLATDGGPGPRLNDNRQVALVGDLALDDRDRLGAELRRAGTLREPRPDDAALVLSAWERWLGEAPAHLEGRFAFVLWDRGARRLLAARDPGGAAPLWWARDGERIVLASAAPALAALEVDGPAAELAPGHLLEAGAGGFRILRAGP